MLQLWNTKHTLVVMMGLVAVTVVLTGALGSSGVVQATEVRHQRKAPDNGSYLKPTGKGWGEHDLTGMGAARAGKFSPRSSNGIDYHGGPLLGTGSDPVNMHYIWYGNWTDNTQQILTDFGSSIGGSPYFNINKTYTNSNNVAVSGKVSLAGNATSSSSYGTALNDADITQIVKDYLGTTKPGPNDVYFVLTSADVNETSGFCTKYCAWHGYDTINGTTTKIGFIGNPARCPTACSAQSNGPNDNMGADAMASLIAHELAEATTDPELNAWYDRRGYENADKCAWKFGSTAKAPNGSLYNVVLGSRKYLLQQNWINAGGGSCKLAN